MTSSIATFIDLLGGPEFHIGLLLGVAAWLAVYTLSPRGYGWGIALTGATIIGVNVGVDQRLGTAAGLALLAVGGFLLTRSVGESDQSPLPWLIIGIGATVTTVRGGLPSTLWIQFFSPVLIIVFGYWISGWGDLPQRRLLGPLLAISAFGIWSTVPDTNTARVLLGAAVPLSLATLPSAGLRLSAAGAFPLAGLVVWVAATGGAGRHASIVGAWACIGILMLLPLLSLKAAQIHPRVVLGGHVLLVVICARLLGLWEDALFAFLGVLVAYGTTSLILRALADQAGTRSSPSSTAVLRGEIGPDDAGDGDPTG